jgi:glycosyltransferase involved in cell wall biosynthesis
MSPRVSVVVPTYNCATYLADTLRSVLAQTAADIELVVVDDGSTDDTFEVARSIASDPRVSCHRLPHGGVAAAKNACVRLSSAPLIAFLDGDDLWRPHKLERQLAALAADPEAGAVFTRRSLLRGRTETSDRATVLHCGDILRHVFRHNFICYSTVLIRRSVLEHVGGFDERLPLSVDYDLWLRVASHYRFAVVEEELVAYRTGHQNLSSRVMDRMALVLLIMDRFTQEYGGARRLGRRVVRDAYAHTYRSLAIAAQVCRGVREQLGWLLRMLRAWPSPGNLVFAAKSLAAALARPAGVRRRAAWHAAYNNPANLAENL